MKELLGGDVFFVINDKPNVVSSFQVSAHNARENYKITHAGIIETSGRDFVIVREVNRNGLQRNEYPLKDFLTGGKKIVYRHLGRVPRIYDYSEKYGKLFDASAMALEAGDLARCIGDAKAVQGNEDNSYPYLKAVGSVVASRFRNSDENKKRQVKELEEKWNKMFETGIGEAVRNETFFCSQFVVYCYGLTSFGRIDNEPAALNINLDIASPAALYKEILANPIWQKLLVTIDPFDGGCYAQPEDRPQLVLQYEDNSNSNSNNPNLPLVSGSGGRAFSLLPSYNSRVTPIVPRPPDNALEGQNNANNRCLIL